MLPTAETTCVLQVADKYALKAAAMIVMIGVRIQAGMTITTGGTCVKLTIVTTGDRRRQLMGTRIKVLSSIGRLNTLKWEYDVLKLKLF